MIIKEALLKGIQILRNGHIDAPAFEAGVLLSHALKRHKVYLYSHDDYTLSSDEEALFWSLTERRAQGEPLQYLTGVQEFMSLEFHVAPGVLIPRQDTEVLVEAVMGYCEREKLKGPDILDIGTGSGCIAVSLAHHIGRSKVTGVDISGDALEIARSNAERNSVCDRVSFVKSSIFDGLDRDAAFDVIVSNPPYIPSWEVEKLDREVRDHEPRLALDGGNDGLDFYRAIADQSLNFLKPGGFLAFEVGYNQAGDVKALMNENYSGIEIIKDLSGIERVVTGRLIRK